MCVDVFDWLSFIRVFFVCLLAHHVIPFIMCFTMTLKKAKWSKKTVVLYIKGYVSEKIGDFFC